MIQEQASTSNGQRTPERNINERRGSHNNGPRFPDPVEEAKQRFSTPRRHHSQSPGGSTLSKSDKKAYPVQLRKNKVIKGPVLKSHYDKEAK